ncbi:selenium cofactor biosynthesis protein YqeC [Calorimonas adulescens]|uniref:Putative selenium-dependent hydroxylase accessory protein YqeC n=1 Tax=Calorimonas adulescens TaxID=2606906 RepID=A0A5D8QCP4_9THEO|nr:selenium cofactor biosynthesis protein YqeC [Calorimonas adulescens]TZE82302.1 putative selenium-dependent hydroxylase accessory protein YqeC [Calorimonas adulescens]
MLKDIIGISKGDIISFIGGGGKTTIIKDLTYEMIPFYTVAITTTTHIYPYHGVKTVFLREDLPDENPLFFARDMDSNGKLVGLLPGDIKSIKRDVILVEADGSKGRSLKAPAEWEPVVPDCTTITCIVIGLDVIGKPLDGEYVYRAERVCRLTGYRLGMTVDAELILRLLNPDGLLKGAKGKIFIILNKADIVGKEEAYGMGRIIKVRTGKDVIIRYKRTRWLYEKCT